MSSFEHLQQLFGYFHQDWLLDYETPEAALRDFLEGSPDEMRDVDAELDRLILQIQASEVDLLLQLGCYYDPHADGRDVLEWLRSVQAAVRNAELGSGSAESGAK
jgi:hypothetical protein